MAADSKRVLGTKMRCVWARDPASRRERVIVGPILAVVALAALLYFVFKRRGGPEEEAQTEEGSRTQ